MKLFKNYLSALAVFALLFTSCSKEESSSLDDADANFVELTFGATLNDLANRSQHLGDIPACGDTAPDYARISFAYGGNNYTVDVDILQDANGYFTDYSELLKIPVPTNGSTTVTLTGFLVFDSNNTRIWAAPVGGDFAGYVDQALPRNFNVAAGTKPYIDVEVLCFDERFVNEYGYVFFDIVPETIYPLCTFINYCNEAGRHWVANYSVDLYFGTDDEGIQLYDHNDDDAQVAVGTINGQYYADPLCLVVPGPPANLANNQPYLYMVIYPNDWTGNYGDINNAPIPVQLSWNDVNALLNGDGTTSEYLHLFIGECEGALAGDGTITPPPTCDLLDPNADCDGDGILNGVDECPETPGVPGTVGVDHGCPAETGSEECGVLAAPCVLDTEGALGENCYEAILEGADNQGWVRINSAGELDLFAGLEGDEDFGDISWAVTNEGNLTVTVDGEVAEDLITAYAVEVRPSYTDGSRSSTCWESRCANLGEDGVDEVILNFTSYDYSYPFYINVSAVVCGEPVGLPEN